MTERRIRWTVGIAALLALSPATTQAQSMPSLGYQAPDECPAREQFGAEVAARLGRVAFAPEADERMEVEILAARDGWVATLSLGSPSMRAFRDPDCEALVRTVATAAAVLLDGTAATETEPDHVEERDRAAQDEAPQALPLPPPPPAHAPSREDERVRIAVRADEPGLTLHVVRRQATPPMSPVGMTSGKEFDRLCTAPCEARLEPGMHHLGVSHGTDAPISVDELVPVSSDSRLFLEWEDSGAWRSLGVALMIVGGMAAIGAAGWIGAEGDSENPRVEAPLALACTGLAAYLVGLAFAFDDDEVAVRVDGPL